MGILLLMYFASPSFGYYPSISFFGVGSWMALHQKNILRVCRQVRCLAIWGAFVISVTTTSFYGCRSHQYWWLLFVPFGMITFVSLCEAMCRVPRFGVWMSKLSETVFFIYAVHEIYILGWVKGFLFRVFGDNLTGHWICYFLAPILTLVICLALYYTLKRVMPRTLAIACGGRTTA